MVGGGASSGFGIGGQVGGSSRGSFGFGAEDGAWGLAFDDAFGPVLEFGDFFVGQAAMSTLR